VPCGEQLRLGTRTMVVRRRQSLPQLHLPGNVPDILGAHSAGGFDGEGKVAWPPVHQSFFSSALLPVKGLVLARCLFSAFNRLSICTALHELTYGPLKDWKHPLGRPMTRTTWLWTVESDLLPAASIGLFHWLVTSSGPYHTWRHIVETAPCHAHDDDY